MQYQARTRTQAAGALVVILAAAALTVALIGLFGRTAEPAAQIADEATNAGVAVTDGWMHNDILNPPSARGSDQTDGWMHNEILNPPADRGVEVTDGWMHNEILNPSGDDEASRYGPPGR